MRSIVKTLVLFVLLAVPSIVWCQNSFATKSLVISGPAPQTAPLTSVLVDEILTLAAPQFGFEVEDFIRMYHNCGCITVSQVGLGTYLVTYGGIGILIVIDGSRLEQGGGSTDDGPPANRKR